MPQTPLNHIVIRGRTQTLSYTSIQSGGRSIEPRTGLNRTAHGNSIRTKFNSAVASFRPGQENEFVYVLFTSPMDFFLDLDKFDKGDYRLATYKIIDVPAPDGVVHKIVEATVYLNKRAISSFLTKISNYIHRDTPKGNPKNQTLIANIDDVRAAVIESFWQEPELPFPNQNESVWWEIWLDRDENDDVDDPISPIRSLLGGAEIQISSRFLKFPEHFVYLMRGTATQLSRSILYTDRLAEIRKPKETADFFTNLERPDQNNWIQDLILRTNVNRDGNEIAVCILDTGVTTTNPLLTNLIPDRNLDSVEPAWSKHDTHIQGGHGTPMAGLALYGDLTDILGSQETVQINHHIESVKLIERDHAHDPDLYGAVTQEAIARAEVINPSYKRLACLAITVDDKIHKGRPSSWSSAIDQSLFGDVDEPNLKTLFFVSSGNLALDERINYPLANTDASIHDPSQSFNSITVGAYTLKDNLNLSAHPGAELLARRGAMSPSNTSSDSWDSDWCRKPDITMEGGNQALQDGGVIDPESLLMLSTSKGGLGRSWLSSFGETSGATALASRFGAELYTHYPSLWPETIRGLIIHSADWTPQMLGNRPISDLTLEEKQKLLCHVGYGVPNLERAKYSANNSLSLITERTLKPYKLEDSRIQSDEFHLFDLPWPTEALQGLPLGTQVKFKITLSYFIEPNPGNKQYEHASSYRSHGLRFKMKGASERLNTFKARVSKDMRDPTYTAEASESWILGNQTRDKGCVHKDIWEGSAADLATRNAIAVYPVGGWWKTRRKHNRFNNTVRYSLIMTIETPSVDTDIYTPVLNMISIDL